MKLEPFDLSAPPTVDPYYGDGFTVSEIESVEDALEAIASLREARLPLYPLVQLENYNQAQYTSAHSINANDLDIDLDDEIHESASPADRRIILAEYRRTILAQAEQQSLDDLAGVLCPTIPEHFVDDEEAYDLARLNSAPDERVRLVLEPKTYLQFVPVECAAETIAAFPNGYFAADLSPMDIYVLARHLEDSYGYELFGVGSYLLAFSRWDKGGLSHELSAQLSHDLKTLFWDEAQWAEVAIQIGRNATETPHLFLSYSGE